ncbi:DNA-binding protein [Salinarimonas rosea]|uniref:DNA-binding protein n=1 Tax=Salinarimonas rosea TaxID=552063 RepID=UPI000405549B|nr:DNA-binding protein [Salinarimonas rosea]
MVDRAQVFDAADELRRRGEDPTVRRVTALLPTGGSPNAVGPLLREWHKKRDDEPAERPEIVDRAYADFLSRVWILARAEARRSLEEAQAKTEAMDGRLIELETQVWDRDLQLDELRLERELVSQANRREREDRRAAEQRAADLAAALSAEKVARRAAEAAAAEAVAEATGRRPRAARDEAPWVEFGAAAERVIEAAGKELTTQEILDALEPAFRLRLITALGRDGEAKVRQWLTRRARDGEGFKAITPRGPRRPPRYTTFALSAARRAATAAAMAEIRRGGRSGGVD